MPPKLTRRTQIELLLAEPVVLTAAKLKALRKSLRTLRNACVGCPPAQEAVGRAELGGAEAGLADLERSLDALSGDVLSTSCGGAGHGNAVGFSRGYIRDRDLSDDDDELAGVPGAIGSTGSAIGVSGIGMFIDELLPGTAGGV